MILGTRSPSSKVSMLDSWGLPSCYRWLSSSRSSHELSSLCLCTPPFVLFSLLVCVVYVCTFVCTRVLVHVCLSMHSETECQPWVPSFSAPLYYRAFNLLFWLDWLVNELLTLARLHSTIPLLPNTGTTHICWRIRLFAWVLDIWTKQLMFAQQPFIHQLALLFF